MRLFALTQVLVDTVRRWDGTMLGPSRENRGTEGIRVFRSDWFEDYFATAHPIMPGVWWLPVVVACAVMSIADPRFALLPLLARFVGGLVLWTLIEYLLHRFVFHNPPDKSFQGKLKAFLVHGYHHEFPNHRRRLVAPLILSVPIGVAIASLYYLIAGPYGWIMWFAGTVTGYLAYDWIHYYTHHFRPTTRIGRYMRRYHMEHHYKDSDSHFGISSPLWDWVFGTHRPKSAADSPDPGSAGTVS